MSGVKANWHLDGLDNGSDTDDPMQVGVQVDIAGRSESELHTDLLRLLEKEGRYEQYSGLKCERKKDPGHVIEGGTQLSCYSCPHFMPYGLADTSPDGRSVICKVAREQEDLVSTLQALRRSEAVSLEAELVAHFEERIEMASELAEAVLA